MCNAFLRISAVRCLTKTPVKKTSCLAICDGLPQTTIIFNFQSGVIIFEAVTRGFSADDLADNRVMLELNERVNNQHNREGTGGGTKEDSAFLVLKIRFLLVCVFVLGEQYSSPEYHRRQL